MTAKPPLVSIGIPTFDRPKGLRNTLEQMVAQTYLNLEIIISDNASTNPMVEQVGREFAKRDTRIQYIRQPSNIGATPNFKHVLSLASGEYFMWAADDDDWSPTFVEQCVSSCKNGESVACQFDTLFRSTGHRESNLIPNLSPEVSQFENLRRFSALMQPSLIYGLHKRDSLTYFHSLPVFDFMDCYFVFRQILGPGVRTIAGSLYTAGVDATTYQIKYVDDEFKQLNYAAFFLKTAWLFITAPSLTIREKRASLEILKNTVYGLISHHERRKGPGSFLCRQVLVYWLRSLNPQAK